MLERAHPLPDVVLDSEAPAVGSLASVGMRGIAMPITIGLLDAPAQLDGALVSVGVDLARPGARGVHMSRLYLSAERLLTAAPVGPGTLERLLRELVTSQSGSSRSGFVRLRGGLLLRRPALVSDNAGYRRYPVELLARCDAGGRFELEEFVRVEYSSTCPCSAALARHVARQHFERDFADEPLPTRARVANWLESERGMPATPHSQRSVASVRIRRVPGPRDGPSSFELDSWIDRCERALGTPVQTAVKREDEQEFALRNGQNLMFCEDAARRLQSDLERASHVLGYRVEVAHLESLHAHDAVAVALGGDSARMVGEFGDAEA